jgi:hypothetical protein
MKIFIVNYHKSNKKKKQGSDKITILVNQVGINEDPNLHFRFILYIQEFFDSFLKTNGR